jgi:hypothetical protein
MSTNHKSKPPNSRAPTQAVAPTTSSRAPTQAVAPTTSSRAPTQAVAPTTSSRAPHPTSANSTSSRAPTQVVAPTTSSRAPHPTSANSSSSRAPHPTSANSTSSRAPTHTQTVPTVEQTVERSEPVVQLVKRSKPQVPLVKRSKPEPTVEPKVEPLTPEDMLLLSIVNSILLRTKTFEGNLSTPIELGKSYDYRAFPYSFRSRLFTDLEVSSNSDGVQCTRFNPAFPINGSYYDHGTGLFKIKSCIEIDAHGKKVMITQKLYFNFKTKIVQIEFSADTIIPSKKRLQGPDMSTDDNVSESTGSEFRFNSNYEVCELDGKHFLKFVPEKPPSEVGLQKVNYSNLMFTSKYKSSTKEHITLYEEYSVEPLLDHDGYIDVNNDTELQKKYNEIVIKFQHKNGATTSLPSYLESFDAFKSYNELLNRTYDHLEKLYDGVVYKRGDIKSLKKIITKEQPYLNARAGELLEVMKGFFQPDIQARINHQENIGFGTEINESSTNLFRFLELDTINKEYTEIARMLREKTPSNDEERQILEFFRRIITNEAKYKIYVTKLKSLAEHRRTKAHLFIENPRNSVVMRKTMVVNFGIYYPYSLEYIKIATPLNDKGGSFLATELFIDDKNEARVRDIIENFKSVCVSVISLFYHAKKYSETSALIFNCPKYCCTITTPVVTTEHLVTPQDKTSILSSKFVVLRKKTDIYHDRLYQLQVYSKTTFESSFEQLYLLMSQLQIITESSKSEVSTEISILTVPDTKITSQQITPWLIDIITRRDIKEIQTAILNLKTHYNSILNKIKKLKPEFASEFADDINRIKAINSLLDLIFSSLQIIPFEIMCVNEPLYRDYADEPTRTLSEFLALRSSQEESVERLTHVRRDHEIEFDPSVPKDSQLEELVKIDDDSVDRPIDPTVIQKIEELKKDNVDGKNDNEILRIQIQHRLNSEERMAAGLKESMKINDETKKLLVLLLRMLDEKKANKVRSESNKKDCIPVNHSEKSFTKLSEKEQIEYLCFIITEAKSKINAIDIKYGINTSKLIKDAEAAKKATLSEQKNTDAINAAYALEEKQMREKGKSEKFVAEGKAIKKAAEKKKTIADMTTQKLFDLITNMIKGNSDKERLFANVTKDNMKDKKTVKDTPKFKNQLEGFYNSIKEERPIIDSLRESVMKAFQLIEADPSKKHNFNEYVTEQTGDQDYVTLYTINTADIDLLSTINSMIEQFNELQPVSAAAAVSTRAAVSTPAAVPAADAVSTLREQVKELEKEFVRIRLFSKCQPELRSLFRVEKDYINDEFLSSKINHTIKIQGQPDEKATIEHLRLISKTLSECIKIHPETVSKPKPKPKPKPNPNPKLKSKPNPSEEEDNSWDAIDEAAEKYRYGNKYFKYNLSAYLKTKYLKYKTKYIALQSN